MEKTPVDPTDLEILTFDDIKRWEPKKTFKGLMVEQRMNAERAAPGQVERHQQIARELGEAYQDHLRGPRYAAGRPKALDVMLGGTKFDPAVHTQRDVWNAMMSALQGVGSDLGVDDYTDDAFQDWFGDHATDAGVPDAMIQAALNGDDGRKKAMIKRAYKKLAISLEAAVELTEDFHRYGGPTYEQLVSVVNGEPLEEQNPNALRQIVEILEDVARHDDELADEVEQLVETITDHLAGGEEDEDADEEPASQTTPQPPPEYGEADYDADQLKKSSVEAVLDAALKEAVTPPGREKQVKKLKTVPGVENPWAVAWGQYKKKHKSKKKSSLAVVPGGVSLLMAERELDAAGEAHVRQVEAAGKGKYPGGLNPPRWVPWSLREIWREAAERWIQEEGGDPTSPDAYAAVAATYQRLMKKHAPESPTSAPYELAQEKEPWKQAPGGEGTPPTPGYTGASKPPSSVPKLRRKIAVSPNIFKIGDKVRNVFDGEVGTVVEVFPSLVYDGPEYVVEYDSDGEQVSHVPSDLEPLGVKTTSKQAAKYDGLADEIEVDGHPARILKRLGQIAGKEALRVEVIEGPRKGDVLTAIEG